jgi:hypothetical protein
MLRGFSFGALILGVGTTLLALWLAKKWGL